MGVVTSLLAELDDLHGDELIVGGVGQRVHLLLQDGDLALERGQLHLQLLHVAAVVLARLLGFLLGGQFGHLNI